MGDLPPASVAIAVLPLRNLSGDSAQDYFSEGTTEIVIANLARIGGLRVISRDSVMRYRATTKPLAEIARELGVAWVVEGWCQRTGQQVMMVVQLIEPATGTVPLGRHLPGDLERHLLLPTAGRRGGGPQHPGRDQLDRPLAAGEGSGGRRHRVRELSEGPLSDQQAHLRVAAAGPPGARSRPGGESSLRPGLGGAGRVLLQPAARSATPSSLRRQTIPEAEEAARKAVQLDDTLPEAHTALAMVLMQDWRWDESDHEFQRALELNPSSGDACSKYTRYLIAVGRHKESIEMARRARVLDPLSPIVSFLEGTSVLLGRRLRPRPGGGEGRAGDPGFLALPPAGRRVPGPQGPLCRSGRRAAQSPGRPLDKKRLHPRRHGEEPGPLGQDRRSRDVLRT